MYHKQLLASGVCENTICFYLHNIKALYRKGCQEMGLEQPSPFREVHFKTEKTVKRCLETDVIKKVSRLELEEEVRYLLHGISSCSVFILVECHSLILHC